jgi:predicted Fe-Mo cluster-binding NifX family protein
MTHRIVVNVQTGEIVQVEYTAEEQAAYDAAVAAAEVVVEPVAEEPTE